MGATEPAGTADRHPFRADRPIESAEEDLLGRTGFARALAASIKGWRGQDSLVVALQGAWGMGKTSMKNLILSELERGRQVNLLEFNPWEWSGHHEVAEAFFQQLTASLGRPSGGADARAAILALRKYSAYLGVGTAAASGMRRIVVALLALGGAVSIGAAVGPSWVSTVAITIGAIALLSAALLGWGEKVFEALSVAIARREEANAQTLPEVKADVTRLLRHLDRPVLVVMDDIDRLTTSEIRLLFQLVKANADFPNLVYLLLFEHEAIVRALESDSAVSGAEFLEKIIQVSFDLPEAAQSRLDKVLFSGLNEFLEDAAVGARFDQQRWARVYLGGLRQYFNSLRRVHRFLAALSFHVSVFRSGGSFEVNFTDLVALEALRLFDPAIYGRLASMKELLVVGRSRQAFGGGPDDEDRKVLRSLLASGNEERSDSLESLLGDLFPRAAWAFGGHSYAGLEDQWYRDLRVGHPDVFDRYFQLDVPEGDISQAELDRVMATAGNRERLTGILREFQDEGKLPTLLDRLEAYKQVIPADQTLGFVTALFDIGDDLSDESDEFIGIAPDMHAVRLIHWSLKGLPAGRSVSEVLGQAVTDTRGLFLPVRYTSIEVGKGSDSAGARDDRVVTRGRSRRSGNSMCRKDPRGRCFVTPLFSKTSRVHPVPMEGVGRRG